MKKFIDEFHSEKGAASVLEATIVFPLVFLIVIFLIFLGLTYAQQSFLQYHASRLSSYLAKTVLYPGYQSIETPFYIVYDGSGAGPKTLQIGDAQMETAMEMYDPYRYLAGLFKNSYTIKDASNRNMVEEAAETMVSSYLTEHGFTKNGGGDVVDPSMVELFKFGSTKTSDGIKCVIAADTSKVSVYLAENYRFSTFFRMIGIGGRLMTINGQCTSFITDSVEFIRNVDMVFDAADFLAKKLGIDIDKINNVIKKITGNKS